MLGKRLQQHKAKCWLVNTGWSGGKFGVGERMSIMISRALVHAALTGQLDHVDFVTEPAFGLHIPVSCPDVPAQVLNPRNAWADKDAYDAQAADLAARFEANFAQFDAPEAVRAAGPHSVARV
jgi:phosphoenolpyruvate carboxykinase (ATP)